MLACAGVRKGWARHALPVPACERVGRGMLCPCRRAKGRVSVVLKAAQRLLEGCESAVEIAVSQHRLGARQVHVLFQLDP
jgi:hypothetical protein